MHWGTAALLRLRRDLWDRPQGSFAALDGMRGLAPLLIVFYHCAIFIGAQTPEALEQRRFGALSGLINGSWGGVDIFFVLSGFLIGRMLLNDLARDGRIHLKKFLLRRSFRIFPAYYLVLTLSVFVFSRHQLDTFWILFGTVDWDVLRDGAWAFYVYLNNYLYPGTGVMSWSWSLCVEEHFYALLPLLLWILFRAPGRGLPIGLGCLVALPVAGRALQYALDPSLRLLDGFYYYSHNRFDELFVGVFIAYFYVHHRDALRRLAERCGAALPWAAALCVAAVCFLGGLREQGQFAVVWQFLLLATGSGLLLVNGLFLDNRATRFFAHRLWYPLARISYGTYLVHPFVLFLLLSLYARFAPIPEIGPAGLVALSLLVMSLASAVAAVMFVVLERPLLDFGAKLSQRAGATNAAKGEAA
jgi:peptidoglycan/LPS O-acetylase OafA/YrhL